MFSGTHLSVCGRSANRNALATEDQSLRRRFVAVPAIDQTSDYLCRSYSERFRLTVELLKLASINRNIDLTQDHTTGANAASQLDRPLTSAHD